MCESSSHPQPSIGQWQLSPRWVFPHWAAEGSRPLKMENWVWKILDKLPVNSAKSPREFSHWKCPTANFESSNVQSFILGSKFMPSIRQTKSSGKKQWPLLGEQVKHQNTTNSWLVGRVSMAWFRSSSLIYLCHIEEGTIGILGVRPMAFTGHTDICWVIWLLPLADATITQSKTCWMGLAP